MRIGVGIVIGLLVVALAGCAPESAALTPPPTPEASPRFASDEEALAAAEEAYAAYLAMSDQITADGGANPERIVPFVTHEQLGVELDGFASFAQRGIHTLGTTAFASVGLQRYDDENGEIEIAFYVCWDATAVAVLDSQGIDVTPGYLSQPTQMEVQVRSSDGPLKVGGTDLWSGTSC